MSRITMQDRPSVNPFAHEAATMPAPGCTRLGSRGDHVHSELMSELPIEQAQAHLGEVVEDAERAGEVIYLTRHGRRVAAIVSPELAAEIEQAEEEADIAAARAALDEGGEPIPWEQVKAELGL